MGVLVQPRTKGPGHGSTSRAFYARKIFVAHILGSLNQNYALEAKRTSALVGFNPDLATLGFHQKGFL